MLLSTRVRKLAIWCLAVFLVWVCFSIAIHWKPLERIQAHYAAKSFLTSLSDGNIEQAAESIHLTRAPVKSAWVDRVHALRDAGTSITAYDDLRMSVDDGIVYGQVRLTVTNHGKEQHFDAWIKFHKEKGGAYRISELRSMRLDGRTDWEKAYSGDFDA